MNDYANLSADARAHGYFETADALDALMIEIKQLRDDHRVIASLTGTWQQIAESAQRIGRKNAGIASSADGRAALDGTP
jgi:hypothetical protein